MNITSRRYPRTLQEAFGPSNTRDCDLIQSLFLPHQTKQLQKTKSAKLKAALRRFFSL